MERSLGVGRKDLPARLEKLQAHVDELEKEVEGTSEEDDRGQRWRRSRSGEKSGSSGSVETIKGISLHVQRMDGLTMAELRDAADALKSKLKSGVVVLGGVSGGQGPRRRRGDQGSHRPHAGRRPGQGAGPAIGGGGGGRPDFAQSGGPGTGELEKALGLVPGLIERLAA